MQKTIRVMQDKRLSIEAKSIYTYLRSYYLNNSEKFPSRAKIISDLQIDESRYYRHLKLLIDFNYLEKYQPKDGRNQFQNAVYIFLDGCNDSGDNLFIKRNNEGNIYFIQSNKGGPIKIGFAVDVERRIQSMKSSRDDALILLHSMPGTLEDEVNFHEMFNEYRINGEWFKPVEPILEKIKKLQSM